MNTLRSSRLLARWRCVLRCYDSCFLFTILQIGDAKMDTGFLEDGQSLEDTYDITASLTPREILWLMDELMYREV